MVVIIVNYGCTLLIETATKKNIDYVVIIFFVDGISIRGRAPLVTPMQLVISDPIQEKLI